MKIIIAKHTTTSLYLAAAIALSLLLLLSVAVQKAECSITDVQVTAGNNASIRITDTLPDDEEFSMESETTRRILTGLRNSALKPKLPFCDQKKYGSCVPKPNAQSSRRQCDYNTCLKAP